ncbi:hypothetical protein AZE42_03271 [Rhizopogon vesiculosus]|uniref:C2H2-type domain-containing protein n=1 Tax=Rhizopogon vesiculosus TaxID=180088 RepID=A0A1J8QR39_9AGAM|nr:hypothetical protein AZE42_03271 [Rhizopogon vesiculosus]
MLAQLALVWPQRVWDPVHLYIDNPKSLRSPQRTTAELATRTSQAHSRDPKCPVVIAVTVISAPGLLTTSISRCRAVTGCATSVKMTLLLGKGSKNITFRALIIITASIATPISTSHFSYRIITRMSMLIVVLVTESSRTMSACTSTIGKATLTCIAFRAEGYSGLRTTFMPLHRPKDTFCPFNGCGMAFINKSALALHLESGSCQSGVDRRFIDNFVRNNDRNNVITNPARLITAGERGNVQLIATKQSWNGRAYECVLCHSQFRELTDLNRHLASPRHQEKVYRCPLSSCNAHFVSLSGLCQYIESERCGVTKFKVVKDAMDNIFSKVARLT